VILALSHSEVRKSRGVVKLGGRALNGLMKVITLNWTDRRRGCEIGTYLVLSPPPHT
jgi:hypothetical protein